ncbi:MAG: hypothetical protein AABZ80_04055 [Gemmatimonadota bacterium]
MKIPIRIEAADEAAPAVEYRWDPDTEILSAQVQHRGTPKGASASMELEGSDGSWLIFDLTAGRINGVEVAVWPDVQKRSKLAPPTAIEDARVSVPPRSSKPGVAAMEVDVAVMAEADEAEQVFHFKVSGANRSRTIRLARDLLLDVDGTSHLVGLWMLNVPPFPVPS